MKLVLILLLGSVIGCAKPVPVVPAYDGSDGAVPVWTGTTPAAQACAHLQALGCPLGNDPNCGAAFQLDPRYGADPVCVMNAPSKPALLPCHVTCQ